MSPPDDPPGQGREALRQAVRERLRHALSPDGSTWLAQAAGRVAHDPQSLGGLFPAVGRRCGRGPLRPEGQEPGPEPGRELGENLGGWTVDEAARALLLLALPLTGPALAEEISLTYRHGDPAERRAVLRALPLLDLGPAQAPEHQSALELVRDALRTNDSRLLSAAMGPYAARHLDEHSWRHGVLKLVFVGLPLDTVAELDQRTDAELLRMLIDYAQERTAAGRAVPQDVQRALEHAGTDRATPLEG